MTTEILESTLVLLLTETPDGTVQAHSGVKAAEVFVNAQPRIKFVEKRMESCPIPSLDGRPAVVMRGSGLLPWRAQATAFFHLDHFVVDERTPDDPVEGQIHPEDHCDLPPENCVLVLIAYAATKASALKLLDDAGHHANAVIFGGYEQPDGVFPFDPEIGKSFLAC